VLLIVACTGTPPTPAPASAPARGPPAATPTVAAAALPRIDCAATPSPVPRGGGIDWDRVAYDGGQSECEVNNRLRAWFDRIRPLPPPTTRADLVRVLLGGVAEAASDTRSAYRERIRADAERWAAGGIDACTLCARHRELCPEGRVAGRYTPDDADRLR
jgi:hypothetical protein